MSHSGDVAVGPHYSHSKHKMDLVSRVGAGATLFHDVPEMDSVSFIGADPIIKGGDEVGLNPISPMKDPPFKYACFSSASLENVIQAAVFYDGTTRHCKGIIIDYCNGTRRALGQCRLGLDRVQRCNHPSHLFYAPTTYHDVSGHELLAVNVAFATEFEYEQRAANTLHWVDCKMEGILHFWFTGKQAELEIVKVGDES